MMKFIISGGGTGGHVFPAIAIADAIKEKLPDAEISFVGAIGKLEMQKVPEAGYRIIGLDITGFQRKFSLQNIKLLGKLIKSLWVASGILSEVKPDAVIGVGGYASGAVLQVAGWKGIPIFIQEQNSYPGWTNKFVARYAKKIFVASEGMEKFFSPDKIVMTGNPVRSTLCERQRIEDDYKKFGLDPLKKTICVFGGSLGARTLNRWMEHQEPNLRMMSEIQILWQVGKIYEEEYNCKSISKLANVKMLAFIQDMESAYTIADLVICRAGALTLAELFVMAKPSILVPSPNVAEDHQRKNAEYVVSKKAAWMVLDQNVDTELFPLMESLLGQTSQLNFVKQACRNLAKPDASKNIVSEILKVLNKAQ